MTREKLILALLVMLPASTVEGGLLPRTSGTGDQSRIIAAAASPNVQGTWSGTFRPKHPPQGAPFTILLVITPDMHARIIKTSGVTSCLARGDVDLHVVVKGSDVVVAGTDQAGNTLTFHGTIDSTGKVLTFNYVTNGSASGKCESDVGTANLKKQ